MHAFRAADVECRLGYDCSGLTESAHRLERSLEFKRAATGHFSRVIDAWKQDRSFRTPFAGAVRPSVEPVPDAYGDVDDAQLRDFVREHLQAHVRATPSLDVASDGADGCYYDYVRDLWITTKGFHIELDGTLLTSDGAVDDFEAAYRANRPNVPPTFDADCATLRAMPVVLSVSWPL